MGDSPKAPKASTFHPAFTVNNIKSVIPITLQMDRAQYISWVELFKINARAHKVLEHILPSPDQDAASSLSTTDPALWSQLDAIVLQWIYSTISNDLLNTILEPDSTAAAAWGRLKDVFQDNQTNRAVQLETEFSQIDLNNFANMSAYCQHIKMIADQLANVGAKVSDNRLVITLVRGLPKAYDNIAALLQQSDPPVSFQKARSMLLLEESRQANQASNEANAAGSALLAAGHPISPLNDDQSPHSHNLRHPPKANNRGGGRTGNNNSRGKGGRQGKGRGGGGRGPQQQQQHPSSPWQWGNTGAWQFNPWSGWAPPPWAMPPCPYPTTPWARPPAGPRTPQPGILGARPHQQQQQAYSVQAPSSVGYAPTDIETALHTLSLTPPDENWYMDTGATSHMTSNQGPSDGDHPYEM